MHTKNLTCKILLLVARILMIAVVAFAFYYVWRGNYWPEMLIPFGKRGIWVFILIYVMVYFLLTKIYGAFRVGKAKVSEIAYSQVITLFLLNGFTYCLICLLARKFMPIVPLLVLFGSQAVVAVLWSLLANRIYVKVNEPKRVLVVYGCKNIDLFMDKMSTHADRYEIKDAMHVNEGLDEVFLRVLNFDAVILCDVTSALRNKIIKYCFDHDIDVYLTPKISDIIVRGADVVHLFDTPILFCRNTGLSFGQRFAKRTLDLVITIPALIIASPIMLIIAVAIKLYDGGPVFYKQKRCTINHKTFDIYKFRSMVVDAEKAGRDFRAKDNDPRITPVGKVIRKIRMDELPQLINILIGDMSIVGPRPERVEHVEEYSKIIPEFDFRLKVKGGLTGYAQVYGKYNTTPYDKLKLDLMYIENYSFLLDLKLLFMTLKVLFMKESTEGFADEEEAEMVPPKCTCENESHVFMGGNNSIKQEQ